MTKKIRIENADTSAFKVVVEVWDKGQGGEPDKCVKEVHLDYPTAMIGDGDVDVYLTDTRYVIVREAH